jgi:hypothetical protein
VATSSRSHGLHVMIDEITSFFMSGESEKEFIDKEN